MTNNLKTLQVLILISFFIMGFVLGMLTQQAIIKVGLESVLSYSNIKINFNFNETKLVEEMNKTIIPQILSMKDEGKFK